MKLTNDLVCVSAGIRLASLCVVVCVCGWSVHGGQPFLLFIISDTMCAKGVENLSVGLSRIYFKPFHVVPGSFCFI